MLHGDECSVCPLVWRSCKIGPMCTSPSAAEARALCDGEDEINAARDQLAEMLGLGNPGNDNDEFCAKVPAVLATDSTSTYGNLGKIAAFLNSKEKMIGVDIAKLQESCAMTDLKLRWVNGDAQLANSLTKSHEQAQLNLFYKLGGRWRLAYDETYTSARKRKQAGTAALEDMPQPLPEVLLDEESEISADSSIYEIATGASSRSE